MAATADEPLQLPPLQAELETLDTEKHYGPIAATLSPETGGALTEDDMLSFVGAAIDDTRLTGGNLDSFNKLVEQGIPKIVTEFFRVDITSRNLRTTGDNANIDHFNIVVKFLEAEVLRPVQAAFPSCQSMHMYPNQARNTGASYTAPLMMSAHVEITAHYNDGHTATQSERIPRFEVSQFPIMVGSNRCHTYNLTREARKQLQEDPLEQGGYFITKGEWAVELLENIRFNSLHVYLKLLREEVRGEFISQPGGAFENSSQVIFRLLQTGMLTIEINSMKFQKLQIPFFLIFRLFGMSSTEEIIQQVVGDLDSTSPVDREMIEIVDRAMHLTPPAFEDLKDELSHQVITERLAVMLERFVTNPQNYQSDEEAVRFLTNRLLAIMDMVYLPHVGQTPESRSQKLRFTGVQLRKMLLVKLGVLRPADRDSFVMKRVHGPGVSLAKAFKAMFNSSVVSSIVSALKLELKQTDFDRLKSRRILEAARVMSNASADLSRLLEQSLTSGNKVIMVRRRAMMNRLASNALERKNPLNIISSLRRIIAHGASAATKGTERAEKIRAVHPTYMGFVCPYHSADTGEKVGLEKQMACTAKVCDAGMPVPLIARLVADPAVLRLNQVTNEEIHKRGMSQIYVNGNWIGCCEKPWELVRRYRGMRRVGRGVTPHTTISWNIETGDVVFWLDGGRLARPLLIIDNNQEAFDAAARAGKPIDFVQNVRFTKQHVRGILRGEVTLADLVHEGICEYVVPEEVENCLLAESIAHLYEHQHNVLKPYSHCDVPQSLCGIAALVSPFANHTQPARVTYETNQGRSTCGWYSLAWPFRADQLRFFQFYNEHPLVTTMASQHVVPSGMNMIVAYATMDGDNQEDSAVMNLGCVQRGLFSGVLFKREVATLEKHESFGTPNPANTVGTKSNASYAKMVDGFVPEGTRVEFGDAIVGRLAKETPAPARQVRGRPQAPVAATFVDRSIIYHETVSARIDQVWKTQAPDDTVFALVKMVSKKQINVGDKISSRSGNKSIVALILPASELPYDEDGNRADLYTNPHSFPSRMVIGQSIEGYLSIGCARTASVIDGTPFRQIDVAGYADTMRRLGFRESGYRTMFDPRTGRYFERGIFMAPTYQQRLLKFVDLNRYAAGLSGPTDALSGQPLDGKRMRGGLRLGEMEVWVFCAQGQMRMLEQKIRMDSDGRIAYYCRNCSQPADCNPSLSIYHCPCCGEMADIVAVATCQASIVFLHELRALGVDTRLVFPPRRFESTMPLIDDWVAGANAPTAEADVAPEAAAAAR
jgi:DNA-directed RNA polymerase beta subunit